MPKAPSWIDKVNFIEDFVQNPCDVPFLLYAKAAYKPAGKALLSLLSFGMDDVARGFFRPKGLRSGRHGRKGRSARKGRGKKRIGSIPEIGEEIGKRIPGARKAGDPVEDAAKMLWKVDGVIQRGFYYWMIADVTTTFFYDWASAIVDARPDQCGQEPRFYRRVPEFGGVGVQPWWPLQATELVWWEDIQGSNTGANLGPGLWNVVVAATVHGSQTAATHTAQLFVRVDLAFSNPRSFGSGFKDIPRGGQTGMVAQATIRGPVHVSWYLNIDFGNCFGTDATVWCQRIDN